MATKSPYKSPFSRHRPLGWLLLVAIISVQLSCSHVGYYRQSVQGHLKIIAHQEDIEHLIADPDTDPALKDRLEFVLAVRQFAIEELKLPDNGSYRKFSPIDRDYVIWNVIAAPALSLKPVTWCFLIVGCLPYRGYYEQRDAQVFADGLIDEGLDVYVGGATAYSTLGWFKDPILSSMLRRSKNDLAKVIFHELAHQKLYIKGDTEFNEAFADTVALIGMERWHAANHQSAQISDYQAENRREHDFIDLVLAYKSRLSSLYESDKNDEAKTALKQHLFNDMTREYRQLMDQWGGYDDYSDWFETGLNNAKISAVLTYRQLQPSFQALYKSLAHDLEQFYEEVAAYRHCNPELRKQYLEQGISANNCLVPNVLEYRNLQEQDQPHHSTPPQV